jgi:aspartyl protease family protein
MLRALAVVATATVAALAAAAAAVGVVQASEARCAAPASTYTVAKSADGHFWAQARVNGRPIRVLVDTGSSAVALTWADARALGLDQRALTFDRSVATASGAAAAAAVTLDRVSVAGAEVGQVHALVVKGGLDASLLGMSYLGRLSGFSADRRTLTLRP